MSSTRRVALNPPENRLVRMMGREPINAMTHLGGFMLAIIGVALLVVDSSGSTPKAVGMAIYGSSLALLFLASGAYHYLDVGDDANRWLKRFDHCAIFLLIAGSYVPPLLHFLDGVWRIAMLALVGGLAIGGMVLKLAWLNCPRKLSTSIYLALGWIIVIPGYRILPQLTAGQLGWLVTGGLTYSLGAVVYVFRRPNPLPEVFGYHEIWHLFVLGGAASHYVFVTLLIDQPLPG